MAFLAKTSEDTTTGGLAFSVAKKQVALRDSCLLQRASDLIFTGVSMLFASLYHSPLLPMLRLRVNSQVLSH